jgi:hypothetical protein
MLDCGLTFLSILPFCRETRFWRQKSKAVLLAEFTVAALSDGNALASEPAIVHQLCRCELAEFDTMLVRSTAA